MKPFLKSSTVFCLAALCLALLVGTAFGQAPINDDCSNAILANPGNPAAIVGTTVGASVSNASFCGSNVTSPSVWYKVIGNGGPITVSTCGQATFDTKLSVYTGNCNNLQCITGNDDGSGCNYFTSELTFNSISNQEYFIMVHAFGTLSGTFNLSVWTPTVSVPNDDCINAEVITPSTNGTVISGTTIGATPDNVPSINGVSVTAPGVWYSIAGTGGLLKFSTCGTQAWDTRLSVYTGACGGLSGVDANDDFCGMQSELLINSVQGTNYLVLVHGFGAGAGNFDLNVLELIPPSNDEPINATPLTVGGGAVAMSNENATVDPNEVTPGAGSNPGSCQRQDGWCSFETNVQNSIWYTFQAPTSGCVSILADGFDTQLAIYEVGNVNDYNTYTMIAANDDAGAQLGGTNRHSAMIQTASCLTPGATYYVQMDGFNGTAGAGTIMVMDCGGSPLTVDAGDCQSLFSGFTASTGDIAYLQATVSGGYPPYIVTWASDPSILYENTALRGIAVQPSQTTAYVVTVTDDKGCTVSDIVTVQVEDVAICNLIPSSGKYHTENQTTLGGGPRTQVGSYVRNNFTAAFPNGLTVGCTHQITFSSSNAISDFLPSTGQPVPLTQSHNNPLSRGRVCLNNDLAGNLVALALNLGFDQYDPNFCTSNTPLGDLVIASGPLANLSVNDIFEYAEKSLGGCQTAYNPALLSDAIANINDNFLSGNTSNGYLTEPGISICDGLNGMCVSSDEVPAYLNQGYVLGSCSNTCRAVNPTLPSPPPCFTWTLTIKGDVFSDLENTWLLRDQTLGGVPVAPQTSVKGLITETYTYCLDSTHCYQWDIYDLLGDGFSYGGYYSISYMGSTLTSNFSDPQNQIFMETHNFGDCSAGNKTGDEIASDLGGDVVAYPNPFSKQAFIDFQMDETSHVTVELYDITGKKLAVLFDEMAEANRTYSANFTSAGLQNGLYFYKLYNDKGYTSDGKLVLQK